MKTIKYTTSEDEIEISDLWMFDPELKSGILNDKINFTDIPSEEYLLKFNFTNGKNIIFNLNNGTYIKGAFTYSFIYKPFNFGYFIDSFNDDPNFGELENISMDKKFEILFEDNTNCIYDDINTSKSKIQNILD